METEIDLTPFMESAVARRYEIDAILTGIHGEHEQRTQVISDVVFDETRTYTDQEKDTLEKRKTKSSRPEKVHTFPKDDEGNLLVPLGGSHGYILGALRASLIDLYKDQLRNRSWKGYGIATYIKRGVHVSPDWVPVGKEVSNDPEHPVAHMVITAGISKAMIPIYYDVVARTEVHLTIEMMNEKIPEDIFLAMLAYVQRLGLGPKGRGSMRIVKLVRTK